MREGERGRGGEGERGRGSDAKSGRILSSTHCLKHGWTKGEEETTERKTGLKGRRSGWQSEREGVWSGEMLKAKGSKPAS